LVKYQQLSNELKNTARECGAYKLLDALYQHQKMISSREFKSATAFEAILGPIIASTLEAIDARLARLGTP
jgi:hypothetical protein